MYKFEEIMTKMDIYPLVKSLVEAREKDLGTSAWLKSLDDETIKNISQFELDKESETESEKILNEQILLCALFLILYEKNNVHYPVPEDKLIEGMHKLIMLSIIEGFVRTGLFESTEGKKCAKWYILKLNGSCRIRPEVLAEGPQKEGAVALKPEYGADIAEKLAKFLQ